MFPIWNGLKQRDVLTPLLLHFVLEYDIKRVQVKKKMAGNYMLHISLRFMSMILGGSVNTFKGTRRKFSSC